MTSGLLMNYFLSCWWSGDIREREGVRVRVGGGRERERKRDWLNLNLPFGKAGLGFSQASLLVWLGENAAYWERS